jgi:hypothetical protein
VSPKEKGIDWVSENIVLLRKYFGVGENKEDKHGTKLLNEDAHNYTLHQTLLWSNHRDWKEARRVAHMGDIKNAWNSLVGKSERKRVFGRHRYRRKDDIKPDH